MAIDKVVSASIADDAVTSDKVASGVVPNQSAFKNIIINGDMRVAQRTTSASGVTTADGYKAVDRFKTQTDTGTWTISQSTDVPTGQGFINSLKLDCTSAGTSNADEVGIRINNEGTFVQHLKYGTSSAESLTLSFWIKTNKTGTYVFSIYANDGARYVSKTYTVNQANSWEYKTITIEGDTAGTINNDNGDGFRLWWWLGSGTNFSGGTMQPGVWRSWGSDQNGATPGLSVNMADSTSNEWFITGVQLEVGRNATDFEHRSYGEELALCQRYFFKLSNSRLIMGYKRHDGSANFPVNTPVSMRVAPTPSLSTSGTFSNFQSSFSTTQSSPNVYEWSDTGNRFIFQVQSTWSSTHTYVPAWESFTAEFNSEL